MEKVSKYGRWMRFWIFALVVVTMAAGLSACGEDEDEPQVDLTGSFWRGVNPHTGYLTEVEVTSSSRCEVNVYEPDFVTLYQHEVCSYTFDQNSGEFRLRFDGDVVAGYIHGDKMTLTLNTFGTFTLDRVYLN